MPTNNNITYGPAALPGNVPPPTGSPPLVFFIQGQSGAATYNYPFTFS